MLKDDCLYIVKEAIARVLPDEAVKRALGGREFPDGRLILVSVGKAAWSMASAAHSVLGTRIDRGIVITKHGYSKGAVGDLSVREAGHPVPDADTFSATREAGRFLASIARSHQNAGRSIAFIAGGETVVHITGRGRGGRNQELALAAADGIAGLEDTAVFSVGSDGTDGPTDAAGGYADGGSLAALRALGFDTYDVLRRNDSFTALKAVDSLIFTGATGTNVNDVAVILIKR